MLDTCETPARLVDAYEAETVMQTADVVGLLTSLGLEVTADNCATVVEFRQRIWTTAADAGWRAALT